MDDHGSTMAANRHGQSALVSIFTPSMDRILARGG